ncbi:MAG: cohesin domain-containing protein [bacterium]
MGKPDPWINYGPFGSNPDIAVFFGTQRVNPCCLQAGATYTLVATVHNKEIPAEGVIVRFYIAGGLAIGGGFQQIGTVTVNLLANATATAATLWQVPRTGHGCIQVKLFYQNDANLKNNFAQQNANAFGVAQTSSKNRKIVIGNPLEKKGTVTLKLKYPSGIQVTPNLQIIVLNPGETITATIDIKNTGLAPGAIATVEVEGVIETEYGTETIGGVMFIVSAGRISEITPISGIVGTTVTVKGEGYGQNETIRIDFGTTLSVAIATTDTQGSFSATFKPGYQEIAVGVPINIIATSLSSGSIDFGSFTLLSGAKIRISPETTTVSLYTQCDIKIDIEGVNNLSGAMVELGFDKSILKPLSAKRGSFFGGEGESIFCPVISENNVVINASRLGGNVSGSGTIAIITFSGLSSGTTKINIGNVDLRDSELNRISVDSFPGMVVIEGYLADFGMLDTQDKIIEKPDYKIDFYDLMLFTKNWKGSKSRYDIWPATGTPPCFALSPDGKIDFEDLVVFTLMWNWYNPSTPIKSALSLEKPKVKVVSKGENLLKGDEFDVDLSIEGAERIMAGHFEIGFNPDVVELLSVKEGEALSQSGGKPVFFQEKQRARGEIDMAILGGAFSGSGVVATLRFKVLADEPAIKIGLLSDLRDLNNKKVNAETTDGEFSVLPSASSLLQSFPNPAGYGCWIPFQLTAGSDVSVEIYNVVGQRVKGIDAGPRKAGSYTQAKEGYAIFWNRTNDAGEKVSKGLYFYKLQAGKFSDVKSLVVE